MTASPAGWASTNLGEIGEYLNGRGFRKSEWSETGWPIIRIQNLTGTGSAFNYFGGEPEEPYIARSGDVLISWAATLGVYVWRGPEAVVNQHIFKVRSFIDRRFHFYLVMSVLDALRRQTHGSGMVHITRKRFDSIPVALPPLAEQRRIVAAIEEQFSRLDAADSALKDAERRSRAAIRSGLLYAFRSLPSEELGALATEIRYGTSTKCTNDGKGLPVLRIPNVVRGRIDMGDLKYAAPDIGLESVLVKPGDLLVVRTNGSRELIGRAAVIESDERLAFASYLIRVRLDLNRVDPRFVLLALSGPVLREVIESRAATSAGQYNLSVSALRSLPIPCPSLRLQREVLARLDAELSPVERLSGRLGGALRHSAILRRSILERAFRGELVPQDPDDQRASVLLERIRAEREALGPKRRHALARETGTVRRSS